jgi:TP901-1 family phage major tail protein
MAKIAGVDVLVYAMVTPEGGGSPVATILGGQTEATLNREAEEMDVSSKDGNGWTEILPGLKTWSIECEGFIVESDAALAALEDHFEQRTAVDLEVRFPDGTTYTGKAYITDFPLEFAQDDGATYSLTFSGTGALTRTAGA